MKNFWHIQLHPNNQSEFPREKVERILKETHYIGMGQWEDGRVYIDQFTNVMKTGDIVLVRSKGPLALVEVIGEPEKTPNPNLDFDWFENRRLIKVLQFFDEKVQEQIGKKVDGTYNPGTFASANTSEFIKKWYSLYSKTNILTQAKSLLEYKKQIILQGPPGTGKTFLAKQIAMSLCQSQELTNDLIRNTFQLGM
ncbi:AAA family ATPase [Algoriphagus sp. D3-2-R+10]|uniref:nSTAND3 domain-containing NTPase n=1 Tax=Algoriphagus aurantiacus TaxID=3103948 RepID=UPI002B375555|nr:AAA family ATPase [Algoriphagus sp. D3-2-R+10]MEB2774610.1 AAA family ATPase [Algoriphagus sp. D3-2-R+10]